jgi:hypothetical protein
MPQSHAVASAKADPERNLNGFRDAISTEMSHPNDASGLHRLVERCRTQSQLVAPSHEKKNLFLQDSCTAATASAGGAKILPKPGSRKVMQAKKGHAR